VYRSRPVGDDVAKAGVFFPQGVLATPGLQLADTRMYGAVVWTVHSKYGESAVAGVLVVIARASKRTGRAPAEGQRDRRREREHGRGTGGEKAGRGTGGEKESTRARARERERGDARARGREQERERFPRTAMLDTSPPDRMSAVSTRRTGTRTRRPEAGFRREGGPGEGEARTTRSVGQMWGSCQLVG